MYSFFGERLRKNCSSELTDEWEILVCNLFALHLYVFGSLCSFSFITFSLPFRLIAAFLPSLNNLHGSYMGLKNETTALANATSKLHDQQTLIYSDVRKIYRRQRCVHILLNFEHKHRSPIKCMISRVSIASLYCHTELTSHYELKL